ncbi:MAG TPA: ABC transporter ATP-binding protein [Ruminococcus sp.]|nr:ABC transporter ATP-binding protein [Ruminococcus sp.]
MIKLVDFQKQYKHTAIYAPTNIVFPSNSISFLMGKNGCGKTTLLKCIGMLEGYSGEILFDGKHLPEVRNQCMIIWDDSPCFHNLSGMQNLMILSDGHYSKKEIRQTADRYLDDSVLKRKVKSYSYGQRKKLMLILADLLKPTYLIMDEISNGLDIDMMDSLASHLKDLKNHCTIILTGHQFAFYEKIAEHIFVKNKTTITEIPPDEYAVQTLEEIYHAHTAQK